VPDENDLPDSLPGFDLTAGLARIMGNKRLYRKLLLDFGANYGGAANEIRQALEAGDFEQAHSLVHNIKGLAGNLEALDLKTAAVNIEILVKGQSEETVDEKQLQDKIAALEYALAQALDAVQTLGPAAEKPTLDGNQTPWASVPPELIKRAGDDIIAAAEMGDVTQIKAMAEELKSESDAMAPFSDELIRLADDFDFDGILKMVRALDS
jgi:two-component system sensor histidine kinase/response regulator